MYLAMSDGQIACVFYFAVEADPDYEHIEGQWLNGAPGGVVHRVASTGIRKGAAGACLDWAFKQTGNIRIDTYKENLPMQRLLEKCGFTCCGTIFREGRDWMAYQKIGSSAVSGNVSENVSKAISGGAIRLTFPTPEYKEEVLKYRREFVANGDSMDGCGCLRETESFEEWYRLWQEMQREETVREGWVPSTTYLAVDEGNRVVGMIDIRHRLNENLLQFGGHIGYSVRPSARRRGYATAMLGMALTEARKMGIGDVLVTCSKTNTGSRKAILKNGGVMENEYQNGDKITQRYWIRKDA